MTILFIAVGLAMDAFAVSVASGIAVRRRPLRHALRVAAFFGGFQALMPAAGWLAGETLKELIAGFDHWVAFGLLAFVGGKMIYESRRLESAEKGTSPVGVPALLLLSLATSIDALAVGLTFSFLRVAIVYPAIVIGAVTFLLSGVGFLVGTRLGHFFERKIELAGGLILLGIGVRILLAHLLA